MYNTLNIEDYRELINIFEEDATTKIDYYTQFKNLYIHSSDSELIIRDNSDDVLNSVSLAVILIQHKHCGYGTRIIKWLESYAIEHNDARVLIESIVSPEMKNLALKLGYKELEYSPGTYSKMLQKIN